MGFTRGDAFGGVRAPVLAGRRRHVGGLGHQGQRLPVAARCSTAARGVAHNPDQSSAFYVFRSTGNDGASWNFPGRPVAELNDVAGAGDALLDKQYMTVDNHAAARSRTASTSPGRCSRPTARLHLRGVLERLRRDFQRAGARQPRQRAVHADRSACRRRRARCNENQFSQPFTGPDGALYVVWANFNNGRPAMTTAATTAPTARPEHDNRTRCCWPSRPTAARPSRRRSRSPTTTTCPTAPTYQAADPGRACVPEKGATANSIFRATNYPSGAVNPHEPAARSWSRSAPTSTAHSNEANGCVPAGLQPDTA